MKAIFFFIILQIFLQIKGTKFLRTVNRSLRQMLISKCSLVRFHEQTSMLINSFLTKTKRSRNGDLS